MSKSPGGLAHGVLEMPCLGRPFRLGTLYDCRNDSLIPRVTLWHPETLRTALDVNCNIEGSDFEVITSDSLSEKTLHLDVSAGLKLSVLGGLVKAGGSGKFLYDRTMSKNQARVSLRYKATSRFEELNMSHLGKFEYPQVFEDDIATHVVTGVLYGADAIFVFDKQVESSEKLTQAHGNLEAMISALPGIDLNVGGSADLDIQKKGKEGMEEIHCKFYGDFILPQNPTTYQDAVRVYQELPKLLGGVGYPKSVAKKVWLYPLSKLDSKVHRLVREISSYLVDDVQELMESLHELEIRANDLIRNEVYNYFFESKGELEKLKSVIGSYRSTFLRHLFTLLPQVRGGGADEIKLAELLEENRISPFSYEKLLSWISGKEMEANTLAVYLEELKKHQIQFAFSSAEMVGVTSKFDEEMILCFDFNIPAGNDIYLQRMEAYLHGQTVSQELQVQKVWYKTHEMRQAFRRFVNFVKTNTCREGVKYVVTNSSGSRDTVVKSAGKVGVMFMYDDACPTMFEPPDQPGKPQALSVTHNSIQLKWAKPKYGATSVQSYTAAYRTSDDPIDQWYTQASDEECLELFNLTPGSLYYLKVTAETSVGSSPTSEASEPIQLPPDQPGRPHASKKNYKCVQLKWSKPKHGADIVQHYTISYQSTDSQWCKKTSEEEFLVLTNLTPGSLYSFKVAAESLVGCSPSSEVSKVQLPPDQPGKPVATEVTHSSVQLKWDKPKHGSKIVERYKFFHRLADSPREWLVQETGKECLHLKKLTSGSLYYFKVAAESSSGSSPESVVSEVWLPPDQPGKPESLTKTHNSIQLKWVKPKHGADIIKFYTVSYRSADDPQDQWCTQASIEECSVLTKLIPGSLYYFRVTANSPAGPSPASEVSKVRLPPDQPGKPVASDATYNSVCLKWTKPKHGAETVQSYSISCHEVGINHCYNINTASSCEHVTVTNLIPKTVYTFKVRAMSNTEHGPESELSNPMETALPPPGKPHASNVTHNSLQLNWEKPSHGADSVQFYTVSYYSANEWNIKRTSVAVESMQLISLVPNTGHYFKVRAESDGGASPYSELSDTIRTLASISQPGKPFATKVTHDSITLNWERPKQGAKTLKHYTIYCSAYWYDVFSCNTKAEEITLSKLDPLTAYVFQVKATTDAGSTSKSEISDQIETLLSPPGKPYASNITHRGFQVNWQKPSGSILCYSISYQSTCDPLNKWYTTRSTADVENFSFLATKYKLYVFKVAAVTPAGIVSGYSEVSDPIRAESWGEKVLATTPNSNPLTYLLPTHCVMKKNEIAKVHVGVNNYDEATSGIHTSCSCHTHTPGVPHKVLIVLGATGAGKTTLINGMANYILGVQWDDDFRYKLIDEPNSQDQTVSQTSCITAYTFYKEEDSPLPYTLTVIDTPGFGDTAGIDRDKKIVQQIKELFSISGDEGIDQLHGIGFVTQAPLARLTPTQRYVFDAILSVFGRDVAGNIFLMITFADGMPPPVVDAVKAAGVPYQAFFKFNNSALFASKSEGEEEFDKLFWKMGTNSFKEFFKQFSTAKTQSLQQTREVIQEREKLETIIQGIQPQIKAGLTKIDVLRQERQILRDHEAAILSNKNFTYNVAETKQRMVYLDPGTYVTNCLVCNYTCHDNCVYADDGDKFHCSAMGVGRGTRSAECGVCTGKCLWEEHKNNRYRFEFYTENVTKTSDELKKEFESAMDSKDEIEKVIKTMKKELDALNMAVLRKIDQARRCIGRLRQIALKPDHLTEVEYIDLLIESEKHEAKPRWLERVQALEGVRQQAQIVTELLRNPKGQQHSFFSVEDSPQEQSMWKKIMGT